MPEMHTLVLNGQVYTIVDPAAARINDEEVGSGTWSSQKISEELNAQKQRLAEIVTVEYSPNLLDMQNITRNALLDSKGVVHIGSSYATYITTDHIPCTPGDTIRHQFTYQAGSAYVRYDNTEKPTYTNMYRICGYDENRNFVSDAYAASATVYTVPEGVASVRISFVASRVQTGQFTDNAIIIQDSATVLPFSQYGTVISKTIKPEAMPQESAPLAFLPREIPVAVGRTVEIYNNQVCPLADKYHLRWVCDVGKALQRKFSVTGTAGNVGAHNLTLEIYNNAEQLLFSATVTLRITADTIPGAKTICTIGDSLTNDKYWLQEVRTLSGNKVSFVGTRGISEGIKHEGRSGFTSGSYLNATAYSAQGEGVHPFWNGTAFDWGHYKTNTGIDPSAVQIFLGTNDLFAATSEETFTDNVRKMVESIRQNDAQIPVFVVMTILPGTQDGIGMQQSTDGFAAQKGKYQYGLYCKFVRAMAMLQDKLKNYVNLYFIPLTQCHDSRYNFGAVETPVNPRAVQTEWMPTEGVHPKQQGYEQMADVMYSAYCQVWKE